MVRRTRRRPTDYRLTTQQGIPVADDQNTLKFGDRGPSALEDFHFRGEGLPLRSRADPGTRRACAGFGAHGYFENYESLAEVTRADLFQRSGAKTPAFVRFSTVAGNKGSFDLARDVRGFAVKLYTQEGNWDIVGNNIPVFFIQDAIKFPDLIHAAKQEPDRGFPQAQTAHDNFWDFVSLMPESTHMLMWTMSDRAIPRSFRFMEGFGVHTFRLINAEGRSTFVKFHWKPKLGLQSVVWNEAVKINGADPDFHRRDLWDAIQSGNFPEWELRLQLFDDDFADPFDFDVLDATKIIPEELVPVRRVGRVGARPGGRQLLRGDGAGRVLHTERRPGRRLHERSAVAGTQLLVPRYAAEAARSPNFTHPAGERAEVPVRHVAAGRPHGDGRTRRAARTTSRTRGRRRWADRGRIPTAGFQSFAEPVDGVDSASRAPNVRRSLQPGAPVLRQPDAGRAAAHRRRVRVRVEQVRRARHPDAHGRQSPQRRRRPRRRVADGLGLDPLPDPSTPARPITDLPPSPSLSILQNGPDRFAGRKIGVLVTDDTDANVLGDLHAAAVTNAGTVELVAPKVGGVT